MIPGLGKMNPAQMKKMMQQLGIKSDEIPAKRVIIETEGKDIIIEPATVSAMTVQGQKTFTVMGEEKTVEKIPEEDIKMVIEQTQASEEAALKALEESQGDLAEAITKLKKKD